MRQVLKKILRRQRRKRRSRKRITGTSERPRLTVFRSHKNICAQIVNDELGQTLVAASTFEKVIRGKLSGLHGNCAAADAVGAILAEKAVKAGIKKVVFDRNGYPFHGRVRTLAEAARKGGLDF